MSIENNKTRTDEVLGQLKAQNALLMAIAKQMEILIEYSAPLSPNYQYPLKAFYGFNWGSIGAEPLGKDKYGVNGVRWNGQVFTRRSKGGKFGDAIWFSRSLGERDGKTAYARLVTFKGDGTVEAEPIPFK